MAFSTHILTYYENFDLNENNWFACSTALIRALIHKHSDYESSEIKHNGMSNSKEGVPMWQ